MTLPLIVGEEAEEVIRHLRRIKIYCSERKASDAAKVFFGLQPGDDIVLTRDNEDAILASLKWLERLGNSFRTVSMQRPKVLTTPEYRGDVVCYNSELVPPQLLSEYIQICTTLDFSHDCSEVMGRFYGFPECCIKAFEDNIAYDSISPGFHLSRKVVPVSESRYRDLKEKGFRSRREALADFDRSELRRYIEHLPCSQDCRPTYQLASRYRPIVDFVELI